jgi:hypothetical protein
VADVGPCEPGGVISRHHALALRRLLMFVAALGATLGAHALASDGLRIAPAALPVWGTLAALTVLAGPRRAPRWRPRSALGILVRLAALQVVLHCAMTATPWAFGLGVHHRPALVAPLALVAHVAAAVVLTALLARAERLLGIAQGVARAIRAVLSRPRVRARHRATARIAAHRVPRSPGLTGLRARGPPAAAL